MAKAKLKVGVIGIGGIARDQHLPYWQQLEEEGRIELVGACDLIPERAEMGATRFGARKVFTDYKKMLKEDRYDIVDVCTQNCGHCPEWR